SLNYPGHQVEIDGFFQCEMNDLITKEIFLGGFGLKRIWLEGTGETQKTQKDSNVKYPVFFSV
ncbi:hypothetical protein ACFLT9_02080, partial [Acidobacteriota bacterium]